MRIKSTLVLFSFFAIVASSAEKKQLWRKPGEVGLLALKKVRLEWRPAGWKIEFGGEKKGYLGLTDESKKKITIWIRRRHSPAQVAITLAHELAHVFDLVHMTGQMRAEWLALRNLPKGTPWYPPCGWCSDNSYGAGDFAEAVSWTFQGPRPKFYSGLAPPPSEAQQELIRRWFAGVTGM